MSPLSLSLARTQPRPRRRRTPPARRRALVLRSVVTLNVLSLSLSLSLSRSLSLSVSHTQLLKPTKTYCQHQLPPATALSHRSIEQHQLPLCAVIDPASRISSSQYCPQETKFLRLIAEDQASALEEPPSAKDMHQQYRAAAGDPAKYLSCPSADSKQLYHTSTL